jgi:hypothetical protein
MTSSAWLQYGRKYVVKRRYTSSNKIANKICSTRPGTITDSTAVKTRRRDVSTNSQ